MSERTKKSYELAVDARDSLIRRIQETEKSIDPKSALTMSRALVMVQKVIRSMERSLVE